VRDRHDILKQLEIHMNRSTLDAMPVIAITALAMPGDSEKGLAAGFDGYISKSIDPQNFIAEVDRFLQLEQRSAQPKIRLADGSAKHDRSGRHWRPCSWSTIR